MNRYRKRQVIGMALIALCCFALTACPLILTLS